MEKTIPLSQIVLPPFDLRFYRSPEFLKYLGEDIKKEGLLIKPVVTPISENRYQILDGVNRLKCIQKLGWKTVTCDVIDLSNKQERMIYGLKVNIHRKSHDIMGLIGIFVKLKEMGMKQKDIAQRFNLNKSYVSKLIRINKLSSKDKLQLAKGQITVSQAYDKVRPKRSYDVMENLDIKTRCDVCESQVSFSERELLALCSECRSRLETMLRKEREKQEHEASQKELL